MKITNRDTLSKDYKTIRKKYCIYSKVANDAVKQALKILGDEFGTELALYFEEDFSLSALRVCAIAARKKLYKK